MLSQVILQNMRVSAKLHLSQGNLLFAANQQFYIEVLKLECTAQDF